MYKKIDEVILEYCTRGMDKIQKAFPKEYAKLACKNFLDLEKGNIFLYTGFYVGNFAETDGPIGTYFIANAIEKLGFKAIIITDNLCKDYFKGFETIYLEHEDCTEVNFAKLLKEYKPVAHFAVERCGRNKNNSYVNAASKDISFFTPALDRLFEKGNKTAPSFAIGDGGNEVGMGNFKEFIKEELKVEPSIIKCDYPIIASVSNWGAYGFIAYLQKESKIKLLPSFEEVDSYMDYILNLGCVDGILKENVKSVDGKPWNTEEEILKKLEKCILD